MSLTLRRDSQDAMGGEGGVGVGGGRAGMVHPRTGARESARRTQRSAPLARSGARARPGLCPGVCAVAGVAPESQSRCDAVIVEHSWEQGAGGMEAGPWQGEAPRLGRKGSNAHSGDVVPEYEMAKLQGE